MYGKQFLKSQFWCLLWGRPLQQKILNMNKRFFFKSILVSVLRTNLSPFRILIRQPAKFSSLLIFSKKQHDIIWLLSKIIVSIANNMSTQSPKCLISRKSLPLLRENFMQGYGQPLIKLFVSLRNLLNYQRQEEEFKQLWRC